MLWSYQSAEVAEPPTEIATVKPTSQKLYEIFSEYAEALCKCGVKKQRWGYILASEIHFQLKLKKKKKEKKDLKSRSMLKRNQNQNISIFTNIELTKTHLKYYLQLCLFLSSIRSSNCYFMQIFKQWPQALSTLDFGRCHS